MILSIPYCYSPNKTPSEYVKHKLPIFQILSFFIRRNSVIFRKTMYYILFRNIPKNSTIPSINYLYGEFD